MSSVRFDRPRRRSGRRTPWLAGLVALTGLTVAGCSTDSSGAGEVAAESTVSVDPAPYSSAPPSTVPCDRRDALDDGAEPVPAELRGRIDAALDDPAFDGLDRSVSVWVDGYGEVASVDGDVPLLPASNQKLLTAVGARSLLDPASTFRTEVRLSGDVLVLVADGDPTLRSSGRHSLTELAAQVRQAGVERVSRVVVDSSRFEPATMAPGWEDWQMPYYIGPLATLTVDDNRARLDDEYLADPEVGNAEVFVVALGGAGVVVEERTVSHGAATVTDPVVGAVDSAPFGELVRTMLTRSDNEIAEALLREIGGGSTEAGAVTVEAALAPWCLHLEGHSGDGSGMSRADHRSARDLRRILQVLAEQPWAPDVVGGLPVAGESGTLIGRLGGPTTVGNVRAKTGTIIGGAALSGYATTVEGRAVVFSVVVNGDPAATRRSVAAIDRLVSAVVGP